MVVPVYIPNTAGGFSFLHTLSNFIVYCLVNDGHSDQSEVVPHCVLIGISLRISDLECFYVYLLANPMVFLEKYLFRYTAHFLIGFFVVVLELYELFVYFGN